MAEPPEARTPAGSWHGDHGCQCTVAIDTTSCTHMNAQKSALLARTEHRSPGANGCPSHAARQRAWAAWDGVTRTQRGGTTVRPPTCASCTACCAAPMLSSCSMMALGRAASALRAASCAPGSEFLRGVSTSGFSTSLFFLPHHPHRDANVAQERGEAKRNPSRASRALRRWVAEEAGHEDLPRQCARGHSDAEPGDLGVLHYQ